MPDYLPERPVPNRLPDNSVASGKTPMKKAALAGALLIALPLLPWSGMSMHPANAQAQNAQDLEQVQCAEGDGWLECRAAAGDPLAMYRLGRNAYDKARVDGDFTEALQIGRKLAAEGDKNGKRLLKMVHLQLSWGNHKDYAQAYVWMVEDRNSGVDYLDKLIVNLSEKMTPQQLAEAKRQLGQ
jgi:hypothetical protein